MFSVYLFCAIVGGVLMLLSLLTGQGDFDSGDIGDLDASPHLDSEFDTDTVAFWSELPFLSLRFWVFGGGMFGITGLILTLTGKPFLTTLIGALLTGLVTGWSLNGILRHLKQRTPNSLITPDDLIGATGTVELPCDPTHPGKVRLTLKGQQVEYPARTRHPTPLALGETIVVVDIHDQWVEIIPQGVDNSETDLLD
jgi:membrane protein implicated in regulation of membrane protease activity